MNLTLQTIPSTLVSELLTHSSMDGVVLDTEHGYFNNETLYSCIQIITLRQKKCFVRFTNLNKQLVRMCLDAGITGVIFSTIENKNQIEDIISYCNYPLKGGNRGCGLVRENSWGKSQLDGGSPIIIGQIETKKGIDNLDEIIECNLDMFLIGPYDISASLKLSGDFENPNFQIYINKIYNKLPTNKLGLFLPTLSDIENYNKTNKNKLELVVWGMDTNLILESLNNIKI